MTPDFTGLEYLLIVAAVLLAMCAVGLLGPDPDLDEPWDPWR